MQLLKILPSVSDAEVDVATVAPGLARAYCSTTAKSLRSSVVPSRVVTTHETLRKPLPQKLVMMLLPGLKKTGGVVCSLWFSSFLMSIVAPLLLVPTLRTWQL